MPRKLQLTLDLLWVLSMAVLSVVADSPCFSAPDVTGAQKIFQLEPEPEITTENYAVTELAITGMDSNFTMTEPITVDEATTTTPFNTSVYLHHSRHVIPICPYIYCSSSHHLQLVSIGSCVHMSCE